jgi:hypothetical protein
MFFCFFSCAKKRRRILNRTNTLRGELFAIAICSLDAEQARYEAVFSAFIILTKPIF